MGRRNIRVRPVRREQVDLRRLAAAIAALAAERRRAQPREQAEVKLAPPNPDATSEEAA